MATSNPHCQSPPNFTTTSSALLSETTEILSRSRYFRVQFVASVSPTTATFSRVLQPLVDHENASLYRLEILGLFATVAEDEKLREASRTAEKNGNCGEIDGS